MSAGIVFQSETHILMGYQPAKKMISGLGGKPLGGETTLETALRETIEEMFGLTPTHWLLHGLLGFYSNRRAVLNGSYTMYIFSFKDLVDFMAIVAGFMGESPYYYTFPRTMPELILHRYTPTGAEVSDLALVPVIKEPFILDTQDMPFL